jgi:2-oxoglutarate ferredoxin oxidoreductase subunit alpha
MPVNDMSFRIGGEAGQGVESSGAGFARALTRGGLHVIAVPSYYSRIRGGHNFTTLRVGEKPVLAVRESIELLLALNEETVSRHIDRLVPGGAIIIDERARLDEALVSGRDVRLFRLPMMELAEREGSALMVNTASLAAAAGVTGFPLEHIVSVVDDNFRRKGDAVVQANRRVAQEAYDQARERFGAAFPWKLEAKAGPRRLSITGNQAFAMGALAAGCKFVAGYPMTPATTILEYMARHSAAWGIVTKHAESETAAINMVVGAAHAGVRAMAPTSGGGFDLMTEGISLAAMIEAPVVIYVGQRSGPATGMATRTAQSELFLVLNAGHGEFPRIVLAPHTPEENFACAVRAFNIAEKCQCLVVVLCDEYNAGTIYSVDADAIDLAGVSIDRGKLLSPGEVEALPEYRRWAITADGVSPRAIPGSSPKAVFMTTSDEHTEDGHITEDPLVATAMSEKRLRKLEAARADIRPPLRHGPEVAELTLVSWGSTYGPVHETVDVLNSRGASANLVHFVDLWPFPVEAARKALAGARRVVDVEGNARAQFAFLLHAYAGIEVDATILKYDGRGFTPDYILGRLEGS